MEEKRKYVISKDNWARYIALLSKEQVEFLEWLYQNDLLVEDVGWYSIDDTDIDFQ